MKVLTLWQPWCQLCVTINPATGEPWKTIETRGWKPPASLIGQRIALHAAARPLGNGALNVGVWTNVTGEPIAEGRQVMSGGWDRLLVCPLGAIVGTATLVDVVPIRMVAPWDELPMPCVANGPTGMDRQRETGADRLRHLWMVDGLLHSTDITDQRPYGDLTPGRYAWLLADAEPVDPPVPFKGGQGLTRTWEPAA